MGPTSDDDTVTSHDPDISTRTTDPAVDQSPDPGTSAPSSRLPLVLGLIALVVVAIGVVRIVALTGDRDDVRDRNEQLEESLRIARGDAGEQIEQLETENSALAERVVQLESLIVITAENLDTVQGEATELTAGLEERRVERDEALARVEELEAELAEIGPRFELMPVLVGADLETAETFADELDLDLLVEEVAPGNVIARPGAIIEQLPIDGTVILPGTVIWVQVYTPSDDETEE